MWYYLDGRTGKYVYGNENSQDQWGWLNDPFKEQGIYSPPGWEEAAAANAQYQNQIWNEMHPKPAANPIVAKALAPGQSLSGGSLFMTVNDTGAHYVTSSPNVIKTAETPYEAPKPGGVQILSRAPNPTSATPLVTDPVSAKNNTPVVEYPTISNVGPNGALSVNTTETNKQAETAKILQGLLTNELVAQSYLGTISQTQQPVVTLTGTGIKVTNPIADTVAPKMPTAQEILDKAKADQTALDEANKAKQAKADAAAAEVQAAEMARLQAAKDLLLKKASDLIASGGKQSTADAEALAAINTKLESTKTQAQKDKEAQDAINQKALADKKALDDAALLKLTETKTAALSSVDALKAEEAKKLAAQKADDDAKAKSLKDALDAINKTSADSKIAEEKKLADEKAAGASKFADDKKAADEAKALQDKQIADAKSAAAALTQTTKDQEAANALKLAEAQRRLQETNAFTANQQASQLEYGMAQGLTANSNYGAQDIIARQNLLQSQKDVVAKASAKSRQAQMTRIAGGATGAKAAIAKAYGSPVSSVAMPASTAAAPINRGAMTPRAGTQANIVAPSPQAAPTIFGAQAPDFTNVQFTGLGGS
jgi:hypothetical protein